MKRYRVTTFDFDTRATLLAINIEDHWEESVKQGHLRNKESIKVGLMNEFGRYDYEQKVNNFVDLGPRPLSVLAFHNRFSAQIRDSFVVGGYYPALVGACALGERILNHLVLSLREDFSASPEYKRVSRKSSFNNWRVPLDVLTAWGVLLPDVVTDFLSLNEVRNRTIHFDPVTDTNDRALSLDAIGLLSRIIEFQFGSFGTQPWFIPDTRGAAYIAQAAESEPFVRRVYLPNCRYVGPWHRAESFGEGQIRLVDDHPYEQREIADAEFRDLLRTNPPANQPRDS